MTGDRPKNGSALLSNCRSVGGCYYFSHPCRAACAAGAPALHVPLRGRGAAPARARLGVPVPRLAIASSSFWRGLGGRALPQGLQAHPELCSRQGARRSLPKMVFSERDGDGPRSGSGRLRRGSGFHHGSGLMTFEGALLETSQLLETRSRSRTRSPYAGRIGLCSPGAEGGCSQTR